MFFRSIVKHFEAKIVHISNAHKHGGRDRDDDHDSKFCRDDDDDKHGWKGKFGRDDDDKWDWKAKFGRDDDDDKHGWKGKFGRDDDDDDKHGWKGKFGRDDDDDKHGWKGKFGRDKCRDDKDDEDTKHPQEPDEPQDPTYDHVFFGNEFDDTGKPVSGTFIESEAPNPNPFNVPALPEGTEPTFANYVKHFESIGGDVTETKAVVFYEKDEDDTVKEAFRIDAPEGGFTDTEDLLDAYEDALEENDLADLMVSLSVETDPEDDLPASDEDEEEDTHEAWAA